MIQNPQTPNHTDKPSGLEDSIKYCLLLAHDHYTSENENKDPDIFDKEVMSLVIQNNLTGNNCVDGYIYIYNNNTQHGHYLKTAPVVITAAYAMDAIEALHNNNREAAWFFVSEARYWAGVMNAEAGIETARTKTIKATRKNTATKGGLTRYKDVHARIKARLPELVVALKPANRKWPSRNACAAPILSHIKQEAIKSKQKPPVVTHRKVAEWIANIPELDQYFESQTKKRP